MSVRLVCHNCRRPLEPPADPELRFARCPKCGAHTSLPGAEPQAAFGYAEPFKQCPECDKELPVNAVLCVRCGYNYETGRKVSPRGDARPFFRRWGGYVLLRLAISVGLLGLGAPLVLVTRPAVAASILGGWAAFLIVSVGSFPTASLRRDRRGRCTLVTRQWICYIPFPKQTHHLNPGLTRIEPDFDWRALSSEANFFEPDGLPWWWGWQVRLIGLVIALILGLAFGQYVLTLAEDRRSHVQRTVIYRGRLESRVREMAETLCEVAGLGYA
jgi:hypothetical protein